MDNSNIKVYLAISGALIVLFILILVIPFSKKPTATLQPTPYTPRPTIVDTGGQDPVSVPAVFTGVAEEELPSQTIDLSLQKQDLRQKTPLDLSAFIIDFDYSEDKFIVTLKDPKDQSQKEFESWRTTNYSGLGAEQFLIK